MNLHQKLVEVRKSIGGFHKDAQGYGYSYVSGAQVLSKIQDKMNELGVLLIPSVTSQDFQTHEYKNNKGKDCLDFLVYGSMNYKWVNADEPNDFIEVPFFYTGAQDDISKAFGSGLTYSERYFIIKFFNLPTDSDDPDAKDTAGRSSANKNSGQQMQRPNNNAQQNNNLASEKQHKMIAAKINAISAKTNKQPGMVYGEAMTKANMNPNLQSSLLTAQQASALIGELIIMESQ